MSYTHGMYKTRIYNIFKHLKQRCNNPKKTRYKNYGGRGIKCLWNSFEEFYKDMQEGYADNLSIERIDNDGNYCKDNCIWATSQQQARNTRQNHYLEYKGITKLVVEWIEYSGIKCSTFRTRLNRGWTIDKILNTPVN